MGLHRCVVRSRRSERALDDDVRLGKSAVDVTAPDAEEMADVRTGLRAHSEVGGRVVRDVVPVMDERGGIARSLRGVEYRG